MNGHEQTNMPANIILKVQIGPMVLLQIEGHNCREIAAALEGYERLNHQVEGLCGGLAEKIYPEEEEDKDEHKQERKEGIQ
jgi:hypothetical protein